MKRDFKIGVSYKWAKEAKHLSLRQIQLHLLIHEILSELPTEPALKFRAKLAGIDTRIREMYYSSKVNKPDNGSQSPSEG